MMGCVQFLKAEKYCDAWFPQSPFPGEDSTSTGSFISSNMMLFALLTPQALATGCPHGIRRRCSLTPALVVPLLGVLIGPVALNTKYMPRVLRCWANGTTKFWIQPLNWLELTKPF